MSRSTAISVVNRTIDINREAGYAIFVRERERERGRERERERERER